MRLRHLAALALVMSAIACLAAEPTPVAAPVDLLALLTALPMRSAQYYASAEVKPLPPATAAPAASEMAVMPSAAVLPAPAPRAPGKVFDRKFALLAGISTILTVSDYEMTSDCLARHACAEADPLLPHSRAGMYASNLPLNAALFYWGYRRKAAGKRLWWLPPAAIIGSHFIGTVSNLKYR